MLEKYAGKVIIWGIHTYPKTQFPIGGVCMRERGGGGEGGAKDLKSEIIAGVKLSTL